MTRRARLFLLVLGAELFLSPRFCLSQDWDMEIRRSLSTAKGLLQLDEVGQGGFRIYLNGTFIRELEGFGIAVWGTLPLGEPPRYILLGVDTGNGFCPDRYLLLDVTASPTPYLTREFADCSPVPKIQMQDQDVQIVFPSSSYEKTQAWLYHPARRAITRINPAEASSCNPAALPNTYRRNLLCGAMSSRLLDF